MRWKAQIFSLFLMQNFCFEGRETTVFKALKTLFIALINIIKAQKSFPIKKKMLKGNWLDSEWSIYRIINKCFIFKVGMGRVFYSLFLPHSYFEAGYFLPYLILAGAYEYLSPMTLNFFFNIKFIEIWFKTYHSLN